ncbi:MAG TPA: hypothetical protein VFX61_12610 [Micromonosporaceae bacterium]|nr:hypothetical protein [Micromonosporaceae bacterium]
MTVVDGMLAGAAGTLALDTVTYADIAVRGRPVSHTPQESVQRLTDRAHLSLGSGAQATNRRDGLGPLLGYGVGLGTAVAFAVLAERRRLPAVAATGLLAATAMIGTSLPMALLGVSDPRRWSRTDWLSDIVPHLAYGAVTVLALRRLRAGRR